MCLRYKHIRIIDLFLLINMLIIVSPRLKSQVSADFKDIYTYLIVFLLLENTKL